MPFFQMVGSPWPRSHVALPNVNSEDSKAGRCKYETTNDRRSNRTKCRSSPRLSSKSSQTGEFFTSVEFGYRLPIEPESTLLIRLTNGNPVGNSISNLEQWGKMGRCPSL